MKIHGWCRECEKVKMIPLNAAAAASLMFQGCPIGVCDECSAPKPRLQINPGPLQVVGRRDNVTAIGSIRGRSRDDRLRVWLALGGSEDDFPEAFQAEEGT